MTSLLLRADGSTAIGTGHLMRCLALAQEFADAGARVALASAEIPDRLRERFRDEGVAAHLRLEVAGAYRRL